jgi:hypothetical protein
VKLRQAREETGVTLVEVANAVGKPQSCISKCETGERRVDVTELSALAAICQEPPEFFVPQE